MRHVLTVLLAALAAVASMAVIASAGGGRDDDRGKSFDVGDAGVPDIVLYDGRISTVDKRNSTVEAIAIRDGEIMATGTSRSVKKLAAHGTKVIDLNGRRVLPGLIDGHLHGMREGYHCWTQVVRLDLITSRAKPLAAYANKAAELPDGRWIWTTFGGWSVTQLDDPRIFTFDELTAAAPNNPVWITGGGFTGYAPRGLRAPARDAHRPLPAQRRRGFPRGYPSPRAAARNPGCGTSTGTRD